MNEANIEKDPLICPQCHEGTMQLDPANNMMKCDRCSAAMDKDELVMACVLAPSKKRFMIMAPVIIIVLCVLSFLMWSYIKGF